MALGRFWKGQMNASRMPILTVRADFANADPKILGQKERIDAPKYSKRTRSASATIAIILIILGIALLFGSLLFSSNSNSISPSSFLYPVVLILAVIFMAIGVLYLGFSSFAVHMLVANTPIAKMEAVSTGFGILEGKFESEGGNTIVTPLSKTKCTFYDVSLYASFVVQQGRSSQAETKFLGSTWKGDATYLTDDTGYTAVSLESIWGFLPKANTYILYDNSGKPVRIEYATRFMQAVNLKVPDNVAALGKMLEDARSSGTDPNLDTIASSTGLSLVPIANKKAVMKSGYYYIMESYLPVDQSYAAAGYVEHTDETLRGKPVNVMVRDTSGTHLFNMTEGDKGALSKREFRNSMIAFAFGVILVLLLAWLAPPHNMYKCLVLETNSSGAYCHYINGSTVALDGHAQTIMPSLFSSSIYSAQFPPAPIATTLPVINITPLTKAHSVAVALANKQPSPQHPLFPAAYGS